VPLRLPGVLFSPEVVRNILFFIKEDRVLVYVATYTMRLGGGGPAADDSTHALFRTLTVR